MSLRRVLTLLLLALLVSTLPIPAPLLAEERCSSVVFLAVEPGGEGIAMNVRVCVDGREPQPVIGIENVYSVDPSVPASFKLALIALELVAGVDTDRRVTVEFLDNPRSIRGPSAGFAFALAVMGAMGIAEPRGRVAATGFLNIDGFVDPVAGVTAKLRAAADASVEQVYVPLLNIPDVPGGLGLEVVYVATIAGLLNRSGTWTFDRELVHEVMRVMGGVAEELLRSAGPEAPRALVERALKALDRGDNYTAASLAYRAFIEGFSARLSAAPGNMSAYVARARDLVDEARRRLEGVRSVSLAAIPAYIAIVERVGVAEELLSRVSQEGASPNTTALLYARALTLDGWFRTMEVLNASGPPYIRRGDIDEKLELFTELEREALGLGGNTTFSDVVRVVEGSRGFYAARLRSRDGDAFRRFAESLEKLLALWSSKLGPGPSSLLWAMRSYVEELASEGDWEAYTAVLTGLTLYAALTMFIARGSVPQQLPLPEPEVAAPIAFAILVDSAALGALTLAMLLDIAKQRAGGARPSTPARGGAL